MSCNYHHLVCGGITDCSTLSEPQSKVSACAAPRICSYSDVSLSKGSWAFTLPNKRAENRTRHGESVLFLLFLYSPGKVNRFILFLNGLFPLDSSCKARELLSAGFLLAAQSLRSSTKCPSQGWNHGVSRAKESERCLYFSKELNKMGDKF